MNFDKAIQALCDAGVELIIIGGWSAILHFSARVTGDLDIFFTRRQGNLRRLVAAFAPCHPHAWLIAGGPAFHLGRSYSAQRYNLYAHYGAGAHRSLG